jgi:3-oxoacyl-[acyl-carrier protein] reductase
MDLGLADKVALVTGASRGIGRAIALALAGEGARVVLCARGAADLDAAVADARARGGRAEAALGVVADVTTADGAAAFVDGATKAHGGIDIVVNNVGGSGARDFAGADEADLDAVLARNLFAALRVSRAALPHLRARGGGTIVLVASIYGREAGGGPSYNAAKAAEISLAKAMARDLARDRIRVLSVAPGSVLFPGGGWDRRQKADPDGIAAFVAREIPWGRFGRPEEIGDVVAFLCSPRAGWITGACIPIDGGQSRAF